MKKIAPLGKKSYTGKKFKKAGPNELNASDKNYIRNNIHLFNVQLLAFKVGKPIAAVEKFIKKEKLGSTSEVQEVKAFVEQSLSVEAQVSKHDRIESQKATKTDKLMKTNLSAEAQASKHDKTRLSKEKKEVKPQQNSAVRTKVNFIEKNYRKYSAIEMAKELNVSITAIRYHLKSLNLKPLKAIKTVPKEIVERQKFIKENHKKHTVRELSEQLNCSCDVVRITLRKLKLKALRVSLEQEISPQTINFIKVNYRTMTAREMSGALGNLSWTQVKYLCEKHGFLKTSEETTAIRNRWNRSEFTAREEKYIIKNHGVIPFSEIAKKLERTRSSIVKFTTRKGLKITKEQHDALNRKNFEKARLVFQEKLKENASSEE